jgi:hypothetical protein
VLAADAEAAQEEGQEREGEGKPEDGRELREPEGGEVLSPVEVQLRSASTW